MNEKKKQEPHTEAEKRPFFSIIMPIYNAAPFLRDSLESIISQDFQDWELIMVDDSSADDSIAIAREYCGLDRRLKLYTSEINSGGCHAPRMRGASMANGQYIVTIDSDDKVSPDLLKTHFNCIQSLHADLVIPEMWKWTGHMVKKILPLESIDTSITWNGKDLVEHTLCRWEIPMAGFAVRRDLYLESDRNLKPKDRQSCFVDEVLSRWILYLSQKVYLSKAKYFYRENNQSVTKINHMRLIDGMLKVSDSLIDMTSETFGKYSHAHVRALEHKLYSAVGFLRLINSNAITDWKTKKSALEAIATAMEPFDFSGLKGKTSPRYIALMRLPIPLARIALKIIDSIIGKKNGI